MPGESLPSFCTFLLGGGMPVFAASVGLFVAVGVSYLVLGARLIHAGMPLEPWFLLFGGWSLVVVMVVSYVFLALSAVSFLGVPLADAALGNLAEVAGWVLAELH